MLSILPSNYVQKIINTICHINTIEITPIFVCKLNIDISDNNHEDIDYQKTCKYETILIIYKHNFHWNVIVFSSTKVNLANLYSHSQSKLLSVNTILKSNIIYSHHDIHNVLNECISKTIPDTINSMFLELYNTHPETFHSGNIYSISVLLSGFKDSIVMNSFRKLYLDTNESDINSTLYIENNIRFHEDSPMYEMIDNIKKRTKHTITSKKNIRLIDSIIQYMNIRY